MRTIPTHQLIERVTHSIAAAYGIRIRRAMRHSMIYPMLSDLLGAIFVAEMYNIPLHALHEHNEQARRLHGHREEYKLAYQFYEVLSYE